MTNLLKSTYSHYESINQYNDIEKNSLFLNSNTNTNTNSNSKFNKMNLYCIYFLFTITISLNSLLLYYLSRVGNIEHTVNKINTTNVNEYIEKIHVIIDYVCSDLITC